MKLNFQASFMLVAGKARVFFVLVTLPYSFIKLNLTFVFKSLPQH